MSIASALVVAILAILLSVGPTVSVSAGTADGVTEGTTTAATATTTAATATTAAIGEQGQAQESRDPEANLPFLFAVFFVVWATFFGYVFYMSRRQRDMQREIEALRNIAAEHKSNSSSSAQSLSESGDS